MSKKIRKEQKQKERPAGKVQRKRIRHNTAVNQEKHRIDWQPLEPDELGNVADRRIMPVDEAERRYRLQMLAATAVAAEFDDAYWQKMADATPHTLGIVIEVSRGLCRVAVGKDIFVCDLRGILIAEGTGFTNVVAVGDRVLVSNLDDTGHGLVTEVLPRRSGLGRADPFYGHLRQLVAANVDQLLIVAAWREPHIWMQLIDEYLIGAARNHLQAIICVNKVDLAEDETAVHTFLQPYTDLGYALLLTSALTGLGLDELRRCLQGKATVLAGLSGVGKSTLINAIEPSLQLRTGDMSKLKSREGRHTTTQVTMVALPQLGGYVVDTPGIKDMGLLGLHPDDLLNYYPDVAEFAVRCRFRNCRHDAEPGCAVRHALENGRLAPWRFDNYVNLYNQLTSLI